MRIDVQHTSSLVMETFSEHPDFGISLGPHPVVDEDSADDDGNGK